MKVYPPLLSFDFVERQPKKQYVDFALFTEEIVEPSGKRMPKLRYRVKINTKSVTDYAHAIVERWHDYHGWQEVWRVVNDAELPRLASTYTVSAEARQQSWQHILDYLAERAEEVLS